MQIEAKWLEEFTNRINERLGKYHASPNRIDLNMPHDGMLASIMKRTTELLIPYASLKEAVFRHNKPFTWGALGIKRIVDLYNVPPEIVSAHVKAVYGQYKDDLFRQDVSRAHL
jgi:hypothetical protein